MKRQDLILSFLFKIKTLKYQGFNIHMAGDEGVEPPTKVLETSILPLN